MGTHPRMDKSAIERRQGVQGSRERIMDKYG
jgi:hypothetical protein